MSQTDERKPGQEKGPGKSELIREDALLDETLDDSFPASDPPATGGSHAGAPERKQKNKA